MVMWALIACACEAPREEATPEPARSETSGQEGTPEPVRSEVAPAPVRSEEAGVKERAPEVKVGAAKAPAFVASKGEEGERGPKVLGTYQKPGRDAGVVAKDFFGEPSGLQMKTRVRSKVGYGTPTFEGSCDAANVRRVFGMKRNAFTYCYHRYVKANPELEGSFTMEVELGEGLAPPKPEVVGSTFEGDDTARCVTRVVERMRFAPREGGVCTVSYPMRFSRE